MPRAFDIKSFNKLLADVRGASSSRDAKNALVKAQKMINKAESRADKSLIQAQSNLKKASEAFNRSFQTFSSNVDRANRLVTDTLDRVTGTFNDKDHAAVNQIMADAKEEKRIADIERKLNSLPPVPTHDPSISRSKQDTAKPQQRPPLRQPPDTRTPHQQSSARTTKPMHHAPSAAPKPSSPILKAHNPLLAARQEYNKAKNDHRDGKITSKQLSSKYKQIMQSLKLAMDRSPKASNVKDKFTPPPTNRSPRR